MNTIYLSENHTDLQRVYADFMPQNLYKKADLLETPEKFSDTQYIFSTWGMPKLTEDEIADCLPNLRAVFYAAGSVQSFARPFLNRGIKVFSAWAANAVPVAEYTVAQIILANKGFFAASRLMSRGEVSPAYTISSKYPGNII